MNINQNSNLGSLQYPIILTQQQKFDNQTTTDKNKQAN